MESADHFARDPLSPGWWFGLSLGAFAAIQVVLAVAGEEMYTLSVGAWLALFACAGTAIQRLRPRFAEILAGLLELRPDVDDAIESANEWTVRVWGLRSLGAVLWIAAVVLAWSVTAISLEPSVFDSAILNSLSIGFFIPIAVVGAWGARASVMSLIAVDRVVRPGLEAPFSIARNPAVADGESLWGSAGLVVATVYGLMLVAIWAGPYGLATPLAIWLLAFAVFPMVWFSVGAAEAHRALLDLKNQNRELAAARVRELSVSLASTPTPDELAELSIALDIELKVESMPEWPSSVSSISGLALAVIPIGIQIAFVSTEVQ